MKKPSKQKAKLRKGPSSTYFSQIALLFSLVMVLVVLIGLKVNKALGEILGISVNTRTNYYSPTRTPSARATPTNQEYWFEDQISTVGRFADLPYDIKKDLDNKYYQSNVKTAIYWVPSTTSRTSLGSLRVANFINTVSGSVVAALDGGKAKVYEWLAEEISKTAAGGLISTTTGSGAAADVTIWIYDTGKIYKKVADKTFKAITKGDQLSLEVAAWILQTEMTYINNSVSEGFRNLASLGRSGEPLKVYIVGIQGENKKDEKLFDSGLEFYYYDLRSKRYINYFSDVYSAKIQTVTSRRR